MFRTHDVVSMTLTTPQEEAVTVIKCSDAGNITAIKINVQHVSSVTVVYNDGSTDTLVCVFLTAILLLYLMSFQYHTEKCCFFWHCISNENILF